MLFDFERCSSLLLDATLAELAAQRQIFEKLPGYEPGSSSLFVQISGIGLVVSPWHRSIELALRDNDEKWNDQIRYSIGDWKLYPLGQIESPPATELRVAAIYIGDVYDSPNDSHKSREYAHLIFLAAAEALLDHSVTTMLRKYQIDAPYIDDDFPPDRCFEYVVDDGDGSIAANYCEIVIADRITQRLKRQIEHSND